MLGYFNAFGWFTLFAAVALPFALLIRAPRDTRGNAVVVAPASTPNRPLP